MPDKILSQEEIDALLSKSKKITPEELRKRKARVYDFRNPERFPKEGLRRIRALHESFARNLSLAIAGYTRTMLDVSISSIDQLTYQEFLLSVPLATCFNVVECPPIKGKLVVEINPSILLVIIDRLMGGSSKPISQPNRELTEIEWVVAQRVIDKILSELKNVWSSVVEFQPKVVEKESNPYFAQVLAPNELVLLVCFDVRMGDAHGILSICYPINFLEPLVPALLKRQQGKVSKPELKRRWRENLLSVPSDLRGVLDKVKLELKDILNLKEGDVIVLDKKAEPVVDLYLEDKKIHQVRWQNESGRKVLKL